MKSPTAGSGPCRQALLAESSRLVQIHIWRDAQQVALVIKCCRLRSSCWPFASRQPLLHAHMGKRMEQVHDHRQHSLAQLQGFRLLRLEVDAQIRVLGSFCSLFLSLHPFFFCVFFLFFGEKKTMKTIKTHRHANPDGTAARPRWTARAKASEALRDLWMLERALF